MQHRLEAGQLKTLMILDMRTKAIVKTAAAYTLFGSGALRLREPTNRTWQQPIILGLHRVVNNFSSASKDYMPSMLISTDTLEQYLDWIGKRRKFVTLQEAIERFNVPQRTGKPLATVTFDDGYRDVYEYAFPLLKRKGIPFTVFVVTDLVGTDRRLPHDELFFLLRRALQQWGSDSARNLTALFNTAERRLVVSDEADVFSLTRRFLVTLPQADLLRVIDTLRERVGSLENTDSHRILTWDMVKQMHQAGVGIESHGASHALFSNESSQKVVAELTDSKRQIESRIGTEVRHLAYPDGKFNRGVAKTVAESGYQSACTTGDYDLTCARYTIPRRMLWEKAGVNASGRPSRAVLECLLAGVFDSYAPRQSAVA
jgi:peptidoglycan/xylan/chitin deacetylase (PgdA/CDA1 family)